MSIGLLKRVQKFSENKISDIYKLGLCKVILKQTVVPGNSLWKIAGLILDISDHSIYESEDNHSIISKYYGTIG